MQYMTINDKTVDKTSMRRFPFAVVFSILVALLAGCTTPRPLERDELVTRGREYLSRTAEAGRELSAAWTLEAAVQRALDAHVDYRISQMEAALATGNRRLATIDLLPQLVGQAGYQRRSSPEPSTSTDKETKDAQFYLNWDILDFGVAYLRRRELADQALAAEENRRRVAQLTIRDVTYAWHQALAWQALAPELALLRDEVDQALRQSDEIVRLRLGNPMQAVEYRSALLLVLRRIDAVALQLDHARDELARLLHLPAGVPVQVDAGDSAVDAFAGMKLPPLEIWQAAALIHRPELRQAIHDGRAQRTSAVRRLFEAVPRAVFRTGTYRDDNRFLANREWEQSSAQLSWNLMRLAALPGLRHNLRLSRELADLREEAIAAAVLSQVSMAEKAYERNLNSWCLSSTLLEVDQQRTDLLDARARVASLDNLSRIRARLDSLLLRTEAALQRAEVHRARMMLLQSAGLLDVPGDLDAVASTGYLRSLVSGPLAPEVDSELQQVAKDFELAVSSEDAGSTGVGGGCKK